VAEDKNKDKPDNEGQVTETPDGTRVVRTVGRDFRVEGNDVDGYIGVDQEYRTYANPTERPYISEDEVNILVDADYPVDVERLTLQSAGQAPAEEVDEEETDTHPSKVLVEDGAADEEKSDKNTADTQGQGQSPGDPVSAETKNQGSAATASPSTTSPKSTDTRTAAAKSTDSKSTAKADDKNK
jgi:hypothetical protein